MSKIGGLGVSLFVLASCGDNIRDTTIGDPGSLVTASVSSTVGVLLDEFDDAAGAPSTARTRVATDLLARDDAFWIERAKLQLRLTSLRLVYRAVFYDEAAHKQALPLPPESVWTITFDTTPARVMIDGHDYVAVDFTMTSTLVSDAESPGVSDFALDNIGGTVDEAFVLPVDPTLLLQRTGFACIDEDQFPPDSVDAENAGQFYDDTCEIETDLTRSCHLSDLPTESCVEAVERVIGRVDTAITYTRIAWDDATAATFRTDPVTQPDAPDLKVLTGGHYNSLANNRIVYKYIADDDCAMLEEPACVTGSGWRRLLEFDSIDHNIGGKPLDIGPVDYFVEGLGGELVDHNIYSLSLCHNHFHFLYYGDFGFGTGANQAVQKNGFCLESTGRLSNNELSPLHTSYTCENQGVDPGWVDLYAAGLTCNWVDITDIDTSAGPVTENLFFQSNPDGFMCEGELVKDDAGNQTFEPTDFTSPAGDPVDRPVCVAAAGTEANDRGEVAVTVPTVGGMMSSPCTGDQLLGPTRNCGFTQLTDNGGAFLKNCNAGNNTMVNCSGGSAAEPMIVRICEGSRARGAGVDCSFQDAITQQIVLAPGNIQVAFTCPAARDATELGGRFAIYTAPLFEPDGSRAGFDCN
jgi:hypothetical protein